MVPMPYFDGRELIGMSIPLLRFMVITCFYILRIAAPGLSPSQRLPRHPL